MRAAPPLDRQTVLLTGAGVGLGRALARAFDALGARLILCDTRADALEETCRTLRRAPIRHVLDLSDPALTRAFAEDVRREHGAPDTLIHNAGYLRPTPYAETDETLWEATFNVGLPAAHHLTKPFWEDWLSRGAAAIYLSSRSGIEGAANHAPYTATKHAIEGFVKVLGLEGAASGICAVALTPGMYMHTPMSEQNYPAELKGRWVEPILLTPGLLHIAETREPGLTGQRASAWDLSEAHRGRYAPILDGLGPVPRTTGDRSP